jgi:hypothetical protein
MLVVISANNDQEKTTSQGKVTKGPKGKKRGICAGYGSPAYHFLSEVI